MPNNNEPTGSVIDEKDKVKEPSSIKPQEPPAEDPSNPPTIKKDKMIV